MRDYIHNFSVNYLMFIFTRVQRYGELIERVPGKTSQLIILAVIPVILFAVGAILVFPVIVCQLLVVCLLAPPLYLSGECLVEKIRNR